mmetsp:Transcript_15865/g.35720  ORF Transcript_15865/g.35720 Transcript_15865/m.35720 type:complete len:298 (-) Transcript_15865:677-1570(-)
MATSNTNPPQLNERDPGSDFLSNEPDVVVEHMRVTIPDVHVFRIPPLSSAGWRCAEWRDQVWQGSLKVVERGAVCFIVLFRPPSTVPFAACPVENGTVHACADSSRYFVLKLRDHARRKQILLGIAFEDRSAAFDFSVALQESKREKENERSDVRSAFEEKKEYGLKEGEKLHITIPSRAHKNEKAKEKKRNDDAPARSFKLAPCKRDVPMNKRISHKIASSKRAGFGDARSPPVRGEKTTALATFRPHSSPLATRSNHPPGRAANPNKTPAGPEYLKNAGTGAENDDPRTKVQYSF